MSGQGIAVVFNKELKDNLRDRRSLMSTLLYALFGPLMILLMAVLIGNLLDEATEKPLELPTVGREHAPALVHFLEQNNVRLQPAPDDPRDAVRNGDVEVVLLIPETYADALAAGEPASVQLILDSSRTSASPTIQRARQLLSQYSSQLGALRLLARGVDPRLINPVPVERVDVATPQSQALILLNMLPYFLVVAVFVGGASVIIDATAGERERNSLEPLLINPVPRWALVVGKLLASLPFATGAVLTSIVASGALFTLVPLEEFLGIQLTIDPIALAKIFLLCLPMILLAAAIQMIIATFAETYKEAQTYTNWLPLVPALPGILLTFLPVKPALWTMLIPTFGQQVLINQLLRGEVVATNDVVISTTVTLALALVLTFVAIQLYQRERILFGSDS
jgi:sodium transport system permease protein